MDLPDLHFIIFASMALGTMEVLRKRQLKDFCSVLYCHLAVGTAGAVSPDFGLEDTGCSISGLRMLRPHLLEFLAVLQ